MPAPAIPQTRSKLKTPAEMEAIREKDAALQEEQRKHFVPERNESRALAYFEIGRYTKGSFRGLFIVSQMITEDTAGKPLKRPIKKTLAEGVDIVVALAQLETALRKRAFR
jgi:hypothetical protein